MHSWHTAWNTGLNCSGRAAIFLCLCIFSHKAVVFSSTLTFYCPKLKFRPYILLSQVEELTYCCNPNYRKKAGLSPEINFVLQDTGRVTSKG